MSNPYQPPATGAVPAGHGKVLASILFSVGMVFAILAALIPTLVLPRFQFIFNSFGTDVSFLTQCVLKFYPCYWVCPVALAVMGLMWRTRPRGAALVCIGGIVAFVLILSVTFIAAYLPLMNLGEVV